MKPAFTSSNRYFGKKVWTWNLPSGFTCPGALQCLTYADRKTGKITNGHLQTFKCYSAVTERFPAVRNRVWANLDALKGKTKYEMADIILSALPVTASHVRIHAGGDFFSQEYFDAWLNVCFSKPLVAFWAFTKSIPFWINSMADVPSNLTLQASVGGKHDHLIAIHNLKHARVVYSVEEAARINLRVDTDDTMAMSGTESFALLENFTAKRKPKTLCEVFTGEKQ